MKPTNATSADEMANRLKSGGSGSLLTDGWSVSTRFAGEEGAQMLAAKHDSVRENDSPEEYRMYHVIRLVPHSIEIPSRSLEGGFWNIIQLSTNCDILTIPLKEYHKKQKPVRF